MIVGITGYDASGKDTVAEYLEKKGFIHYSLSDEIRDELKKKKIKITKEHLIKKGNELRRLEGPSVLATRIVKKIEDRKNYVITSIRNPHEVERLKELDGFILLKVEAPVEKRFELMKKRDRKGDYPTLKKFTEMEKEEESDNPLKQQLHLVANMAQITIKNVNDLDSLYKKIDKFLKDWSPKLTKERPKWDDYFIEISKTIAKRATCDRGRSGCVFVKDNQILVSGYVGSPKGFPHCDEAGHEMKKVLHEDGSISNHCVRTVHSEQNGIAQAARSGISLEGSTLYCKMTPCRVCSMLIINCGVKRVVCEKIYHAGAQDMLEKAGVKVKILNKELEKYEGMTEKKK